MENYIDTSNNSLAIGLVSLIIVFLSAKYMIENSYTEEERETEYNTIRIYSAIVSVVISIICMMLYKKMLIYNGTRGMLEENFYE